MNGENIIGLTDELGNIVQFEFLDLIPYKHKEYVVLLPVADDDRQVVILELASAEGDQESYVGVENQFVLETVFALFQERNRDIFDFE